MADEAGAGKHLAAAIGGAVHANHARSARGHFDQSGWSGNPTRDAQLFPVMDPRWIPHIDGVASPRSRQGWKGLLRLVRAISVRQWEVPALRRRALSDAGSRKRR